ncbi:hypothetical protein NDU88_001800 [Pleurodeles waltl]|uniref:Uncharacterized protein n=1 Tax=Pleurodeles waltl TaxID=8319 RepID=A0AAV7Q5D3_PLEWA|nr:hypothetical protein NDU88_001800 [Pleurodeles waltl]
MEMSAWSCDGDDLNDGAFWTDIWALVWVSTGCGIGAGISGTVDDRGGSGGGEGGDEAGGAELGMTIEEGSMYWNTQSLEMNKYVFSFSLPPVDLLTLKGSNYL